MRIVMFSSYFWPGEKAGGTIRSLQNLVEANSEDHDITVITRDRDIGDPAPYPGLSGRFTRAFGAKVMYVDLHSPQQLGSIYNRLRHDPGDLMIINGIWNRQLALTPAALLSVGFLRPQKVALMPHGSLEPGALGMKATKKKIGVGPARALYRRCVDFAAATSADELKRVSAWLPEAEPLLVSGLPDTISTGPLPAETGSLRLLFLGRIHPVKGLRELLLALEHLEGATKLSVWGPIEDESYWEQCQEIAQNLPAHCEVRYEGALNRDQLTGVLWSSDVLVSLTTGENFGHTIAEALQAGCPVITTDATPWSDVIGNGGGEIVRDRNDHKVVAEAIDRLRSRTQSERVTVRAAAREAYDQFQVDQPGDLIAQVSERMIKSVPASP